MGAGFCIDTKRFKREMMLSPWRRWGWASRPANEDDSNIKSSLNEKYPTEGDLTHGQGMGVSGTFAILRPLM